MPDAPQTRSSTLTAKLLLVLLSLSWGLTWPAMKMALYEIPPVSLRLSAAFLGFICIVVAALATGHRIGWPTGRAWVHYLMSGLFNIVLFGLFAAFGQLSAATSRVTILAYTMPIWTVALARPILGEELNLIRTIALTLCIVGIGVLVYPLAGAGGNVPIGAVLAVLSGASWACGTVYLKWAKLTADPLTISVWQFLAAFVVLLLVLPLFEGTPQVWPSTWYSLSGILYTGLIGGGLSYYLWFKIMHHTTAMTAALGILSVPLVGVVSSMIILGERPTLPDFIGFALIFSASACVLLAPQTQLAGPKTSDRRA